MKKEIVLAIIFGLIVGLGVTFSIYFLTNRHHNDQEEKNQSVTDRIVLDPIGLPKTATESASLVSLLAPENESVQTEKNVQLKGKTEPNKMLVIFVNEDDQIITSDDQGAFELEVELESGSNIISAHLIGPDDENELNQTQITVIHTNRSLEEKLVSDEEVRDAVAQKDD